tara:strand:- start:5683 stop:7182 length:1500 start_codon:yes stop_codon:yes gene_type:complete
MEEFYNPPRRRIPRQYSYRGSYRRPGSIRESFNPAANILSAIEDAEGKFVKRRKDINLFEQQAMDRRLKLQEMVDDTKTMDENPFKTQMTQEFSQMVDDLYKADIESFDGDRTSYMQKANNAQKVIGDFQKIVGLIDADVDEYRDKSPAELEKLVLRSQFAGKNGMKRKDYQAFLNDPSKMGMRIQNGELIITNNGKDLFNGTRYLNSKKNGYSLLEYGDDYTKQIDAAAKDAMQGVGDLAIIRKYERLADEGKKLNTFTDVDYRKAVEAYRDNLMKSDKIDALINESTFQRYGTSTDVYNADKHFEETKKAIIDDLVKKQFPTAYRTKQIVSKLVTPKDNKEEEKDLTTEEKFDFSLIQSIQDQSIDAFKNQKEVPSTLETKARGALLKDFKNKEIKIGRTKYQIYDFDVMRNDNGTLKFQPLIVDMRTKEKIPAPATYDVNKIVDFANDLEQGDDLQYNVIQVSTPQEAMELNPGSVFSLEGKKYIVTKKGSAKPID